MIRAGASLKAPIPQLLIHDALRVTKTINNPIPPIHIVSRGAMFPRRPSVRPVEDQAREGVPVLMDRAGLITAAE